MSGIEAKHFEEEAMKLANVTLAGGVPHPYLIQLLAYVPERCAIVMELCEGHLQWFRTKGPGVKLAVSKQVELMEQAGGGCCWIVAQHLVHRDLKMENILISKTVDAGGNEKFVPKIADFGLAERRSSSAMGIAGTKVYMAPEAHDGWFSESSDVYSFGLVMLRTFCPERIRLVDRINVHEQGESWLAGAWKRIDAWITDHHCKDGAACICKCTQTNMLERPSFLALVRKLRALRLDIERARRAVTCCSCTDFRSTQVVGWESLDRALSQVELPLRVRPSQ
eukprot:3449963-Amphidinium_carterae.2